MADYTPAKREHFFRRNKLRLVLFSSYVRAFFFLEIS